MAKFEARICKDMPTDCCDYGVISFETGKEVCRVWLEEDARKIADLLNGAPASNDVMPTIEDCHKMAAQVGMRFVPYTLSEPAPASAAEPIERLARARQNHMDALKAYNERVKLVMSERERGNHSMNVDLENRAMTEAQSAFIKAAQDIADAARADLGLAIDT